MWRKASVLLLVIIIVMACAAGLVLARSPKCLAADDNRLILQNDGPISVTCHHGIAAADAAFGIQSPKQEEYFPNCISSEGKTAFVGNFSAGTELVFYLYCTWLQQTVYSTDPSRCQVEMELTRFR